MSAHILRFNDHIVAIECDDNTNRRSRAAQIGAVKRWYEREMGVKLTLSSTSYSETYGFLHRSTFNYTVNTLES
jgi:hypothetical protein